MDENCKNKSMRCCKVLKSYICFIVATVLFVLMIIALLWFANRYLFCGNSIAIQSGQTVEYSTSSYIYPCYPDYVQFYKNRFPYRRTVKNSSAAFITFIICASCVLAIAIVCVALLAINANKSELTRKKLCALKSACDKVESCLSDENTKLRQTYDGVQTEYYPKNKAAADIFKAYANAIAEL